MKENKNISTKKILALSCFGAIPVVTLILLMIYFAQPPEEGREPYNKSLGNNILEIFNNEIPLSPGDEVDQLVSFTYEPEQGRIHVAGKSDTYLYRMNMTIEKNLDNQNLVKYFINKEYESKGYQMTGSERHEIIPNPNTFLVEYKSNNESDTQRYYTGTFKDEEYIYSFNRPLGDEDVTKKEISLLAEYKVSLKDSSMMVELLETMIIK